MGARKGGAVASPRLGTTLGAAVRWEKPVGRHPIEVENHMRYNSALSQD